jgi:hypothetical protein
MSFTVTERFAGRKPADGDNPSNEVPYLVMGDDVEEDARAALRAQALSDYPTLGTLTLKQAKIDERLGPGWFIGTAVYGSPEQNKDTEESSFSFDTTGGTFKILQSKETINSYAETGSAPDMQGAINASSDGVEGVDITIPQYAFSETHYIADADVTLTYRGVLFALTGTVCDDSFKGCAEGEGLFLGARGQKRGRGDWEITFNFAASPNVTGLTIGPITSIAKKGWEYLWVWYIKKTQGTGANQILTQVPKFVYVERVYDPGDFSMLAIGT